MGFGEARRGRTVKYCEELLAKQASNSWLQALTVEKYHDTDPLPTAGGAFRQCSISKPSGKCALSHGYFPTELAA